MSRPMPYWVHQDPKSKRIWCINEARRRKDANLRKVSKDGDGRTKGAS